MIKKYCDCCGKKLEYIRTFSKTILNSRKNCLKHLGTVRIVI